MKSSLFHFGIWIVACIIALVVQGFWYAAIANKSATVAGLQDQIDTKAQTAGRVASARSALAQIAGDESAVQSYFVPETSVVSFINNLETRAQEQAATLKVLSVSVGDAGAQPTIVFSLTVSGTFDAVMRTVGAIEYAPYDLSLSKLSIGKDDKTLWHANVELIVGSVSEGTATSTQAATTNVFSLQTDSHSYFLI